MNCKGLRAALVAFSLVLGVTDASKAEEVTLPASGGAAEISIHEDTTLTVSDDVEYGSLTLSGNGKPTLADDGGVRVSANGVVFAKQNTLTGGFGCIDERHGGHGC